MILLRALANLVQLLLLVLLSLLGLAVAVFTLRGGDKPLSIPALAENLRLPQLEGKVRDFLEALEAPGVTASLSALSGFAAMVLALMLLAGALRRRRERLVLLERSEEGTLAARRRPLGQVVGALAEQVRGVTQAKVKVRPRGRGTGGSIEVAASHPANAVSREVRERTADSLRIVTEPFRLRARVHARPGERGARVQ